MTEQIKYVAIGDSFTEGVGDILPGGRFHGDKVRGWADLVAQGIANSTGETILYANLAIRGRLLKAIIDEQLQAALNLKPTLLSFNGGGNDMLRPRTKMQWITQATENALLQIMDAGVEPLLLSGANPTASLPSGQAVKL
ncbi:MAG TPA: SGNH/GDSL hydrolase family protein, partial [Microbacteriaceae bacterium]|nr:SGNH/GDSL hydrolase family protein [Microbacteriaceae bacterium]